MNERIDKLYKEHMAACSDYLDAEDAFDDARTARNAASKVMLIASKALDSAIHYDKSIEEERKKSIRDRLHEKKSNLWADYNIARKAAETAKEVECKVWADHIKASNDCRKYEEDN